MDELTGQTLGGRFRVEAFLGRGGMADVYKVWDDQRAVYMAMKVLRSDVSEDVVFLRHFNREAETLGRLQHPNIVRCYGLGSLNPPKSDQHLTFLLMDFIDGLTLRQEIFMKSAGIGMQPPRILQIMRPVCAALHYAHKMGLVHCDLKPANIMLHQNGTVFLTDFGIARVAESSTHTPASSGTPAYMAPEQLLGFEPTPASDIYALGVVLFEMLTGGERPFTGEAAKDPGTPARKIVWEKRHLQSPSPRVYKPNLDPALEAIVMRCLERDPRSRYASALDLLHALEAAISEAELGTLAVIPDIPESGAALIEPREVEHALPFDLPVDPLPAPADAEEQPDHSEPMVEKSSSPLRRLPRLRVLLAAPALVILAGLLWAFFLHPGGSGPGGPATQAIAGAAAPLETSAAQYTPTAVTPSPLPSETPPATTATPQPAVVVQATATATPMGGASRVAFASDRSGSVQIWFMDADGSNRVQITEAKNGACQPAWAPDGKRLAYITPCNGPRITYPGASIRILDLETGQEIAPYLPGGGFDPVWAPDGQSIAYTAIINGRTEIHLLRLPDLTTITLSDRGAKSENPSWSPDGQFIAFTSDDNGMDEIWTMRKDGKSQEVFSQGGRFKNFYKPRWSPDGTRILSNLRELNINVSVLVLFERANPRGGEVPLLKEVTRMEDASFSPDGGWIAYWSVVEGNNMEIYRVDISGTEIHRFTDHKARDFHPAWSPQ